MEWYLNVLKNYAVFSGRAGRKEYWLFILIHSVIATGMVIVDFQLQLYFILYMSYALVMLVPCMSVIVRRLHDTGRSGWWYFVSAA